MVTGVKPDEQVDWADVVATAAEKGECSKRGCTVAAALVSGADGVSAGFCGVHGFRLGIIAAVAFMGGLESSDKVFAFAAELAGALEVRNV